MNSRKEQIAAAILMTGTVAVLWWNCWDVEGVPAIGGMLLVGAIALLLQSPESKKD